MKVLAVFVLVQIVGSLGGRIVSKRDLTRDEESRLIEIFQNSLNNADFSTVEGIPPNFNASGKINCRIYGGPGAHNAVLKSTENYIKSLAVLTNETRIQVQTAVTLPHGRLDFVVEKACHWVMTANILRIAYAETVKRCWNPEEHTSIDLMNNVSTAVLQHVCQNKGSRISAFFADGGMNCLSSSIIGIQNCANTTLNVSTSNISQQSASIDPLLIIQACTEFETFQQCVNGELRICELPTPAYKINSLINIVKKTSGCEDILKANIIPTPNNSEEV